MLYTLRTLNSTQTAKIDGEELSMDDGFCIPYSNRYELKFSDYKPQSNKVGLVVLKNKVRDSIPIKPRTRLSMRQIVEKHKSKREFISVKVKLLSDLELQKDVCVDPPKKRKKKKVEPSRRGCGIYSNKYRRRVVKMMFDEGLSIAQTSRHTGVTQQTLSKWKRKFAPKKSQRRPKVTTAALPGSVVYSIKKA